MENVNNEFFIEYSRINFLFYTFVVYLYKNINHDKNLHFNTSRNFIC